MCGGTSLRIADILAHEGLSPRVRGNPVDLVSAVRSNGSIPACAGEPTSLSRCAVISRVYPRVCGGTPMGLSRDTDRRGLSPRVRGNLHCDLNAD